MKLKLFFRMLLCSMALLSFAACSDDDDPLFIEDGVTAYVGNVVVDQNDGTTYTDKDVKIELTFDAVANTAEMLVKQLREHLRLYCVQYDDRAAGQVGCGRYAPDQ